MASNDDELMAANRRLEERVRELQRAGEQAGIARGRFLATAGHDLRQPLQTLGILVDILRRRTADGELLALVDRQAAALWSMRELLDSFLDLGRIDAGAVTPEECDFSIRDMLAALGEEFEAETSRRGIRLKVVPCSVAVHSDPALLRRIVECLVSNAIRYGDARRITVGCRRRGERLRLEVRDTGAGIAPERLAEVLDEEQSHRGGGHRMPGFALAVTVARQLAGLLRMRLEVCALPRGGFVFAVEPAVADAARSPSLAGGGRRA